MSIGHRAKEVWQRISFKIPHNPFIWSSDLWKTGLYSHNNLGQSAQYGMHAFVFKYKTILFFKGRLATSAGSESIACRTSSPIYFAKSLIKSQSSSHLPVLVCLISCCRIAFPFECIIHHASSPLPRQVLRWITADLHPIGRPLRTA